MKFLSDIRLWIGLGLLCLILFLWVRSGQGDGYVAELIAEVEDLDRFYDDLVQFMTSGPIVVSVLEGPGAIAKNRELMGPTNSQEAEKGTIRGDFGTDIERNAAHGSDAPETARLEISYWFNAGEIQALVEALPA